MTVSDLLYFDSTSYSKFCFIKWRTGLTFNLVLESYHQNVYYENCLKEGLRFKCIIKKAHYESSTNT